MIREATLDDIPAIIDIGLRFHGATTYARFGAEFSETKLRATLQAQIESDRACVLVAENAGSVEGIACAVVTQLYMSDDDIAVELYWWVNEALRGGPTAIRMMDRLERWSAQMGCKAFAMSSMVTITDSPADEIYRRRGYTNIEKSWIKEI